MAKFHPAESDQRHEWPADFPRVTIHTSVTSLKNHPDYKQAKAGDTQAAERVVESKANQERLRDLGRKYPDAILVYAHADEAAGPNKIPLELALLARKLTGLPMEHGIIQTNRTRHTGAPAIYRLLTPPKFSGPVEQGRTYILFDDVVTSGSTFATLKNYIESHGGKVVATSAMASTSDGQTGYGGDLALKPETLAALRKHFTPDNLDATLREYDIAPNHKALTNSQARYILSFRGLDSFRARATEARLNLRRQGLLSENGDTLPATYPIRPGQDRAKLNDDASGRPSEDSSGGAKFQPADPTPKERAERLGVGALYSNTLKALESWQGKGTVEQLRAHLAKFKGAKDEADWIGLGEWLKGKVDSGQRTVTRDEVRKFVEQNRVDVREVVRGDMERQTELEALTTQAKKLVAEIDRAKVKAFGTEAQWGETSHLAQVNARNWAYDAANGDSEARRKIDRLQVPESQKSALLYYGELVAQSHVLNLKFLGARQQQETKFSQYQLPGGENYRELLLTLPGRTMPEGYRVEQRADGFHVINQHGSDLGRWKTQEEAENSQARHPDSSAFRSSHFDEPNVLAHVRFNERTMADGRRIVFLEEVQSDWHQKGRREGYNNQQAKERRAQINDRLKELLQKFGNDGARMAKESPEYEELRKELNTLPISGTVPNAPFKGEGWKKLALKRMMVWAAENGYDGVGWTTGEQQAARYDLSKQVDRVTYNPETQRIGAYKDGQRVIDEGAVRPEQLANYIGKDLAEKIIKQPANVNGLRELQGDNLKVGGEGMKGFYDRELPNIANDLAKQHGQRVETVEVPTDPYEHTVWNVRNPQGEVIGTEGSEPAAWRLQARFPGSSIEKSVQPPQSEPIHFLPTPEPMRAAIGERGLPMFQKAEPPLEAQRTEEVKAQDEVPRRFQVSRGIGAESTLIDTNTGEELPAKYPNPKAAQTEADRLNQEWWQGVLDKHEGSTRGAQTKFPLETEHGKALQHASDVFLKDASRPSRVEGELRATGKEPEAGAVRESLAEFQAEGRSVATPEAERGASYSLVRRIGARYSVTRGNENLEPSDRKAAEVAGRFLADVHGAPAQGFAPISTLGQSYGSAFLDSQSAAIGSFERYWRVRFLGFHAPEFQSASGFSLPWLPGYSFLSDNIEHGLFAVAGHEWTENLRNQAPKIYKRLLAAVEPLIKNLAGYQQELADTELAKAGRVTVDEVLRDPNRQFKGPGAAKRAAEWKARYERVVSEIERRRGRI
ncbi:MAG: phosphoribosyltransferase [Verrucomicrobia bacterium]|nr:phosphoribosyltransferase [Verrucomicrobiota bacterium]